MCLRVSSVTESPNNLNEEPVHFGQVKENGL